MIACGPSTWQKGPEFESHLGYMIPFLKTVMTKPGCVMDGRLVDLKCHLDEIQPLLAERPLDAPGGRVILGGLIKVGRSMLTMGETIPWDGNRGELRTSIHLPPAPTRPWLPCDQRPQAPNCVIYPSMLPATSNCEPSRVSYYSRRKSSEEGERALEHF